MSATFPFYHIKEKEKILSERSVSFPFIIITLWADPSLLFDLHIYLLRGHIFSSTRGHNFSKHQNTPLNWHLKLHLYSPESLTSPLCYWSSYLLWSQIFSGTWRHIFSEQKIPTQFDIWNYIVLSSPTEPPFWYLLLYSEAASLEATNLWASMLFTIFLILLRGDIFSWT
jgi:hypothetical protein